MLKRAWWSIRPMSYSASASPERCSSFREARAPPWALTSSTSLKRGLAPVAMINLRSEPIVAVGAIISSIPLVDRVAEEILQIKSGTLVEVDADGGLVRIFEA